MRERLGRLATHRHASAYGLIVLFAAVSLVVWAVGRLDLANFILTLTVLFVSTLALQVAWLSPAKLIVERQHETATYRRHLVLLVSGSDRPWGAPPDRGAT